jgi:tRNA(Ser,Leu) C12 N-acetylase TAN1
MKDWNVVISVYQDGFKRAVRALQQFGPVERSPYHNVLLMKVDDPIALLEGVERLTDEIPAVYDAISRIAPATRTFEFQSAEEFQEKASSVVTEWLSRLAGRSFHVRFHRRGHKHDLRTPEVERVLDDILLDRLKQAGTPGTISFNDPDLVIVLDTVDDRAAVGCWAREDMACHRLLRPDA